MNEKEIANILRDYHWMIRQIIRLREELNEDSAAATAQYGIEATLPKAAGISDPVLNETMRRLKKSKFQERLEQKVLYIQNRLENITDEREKAVLDCILDGLSNSAIARHMGLSEKHIGRIKESIAKQLAEE